MNIEKFKFSAARLLPVNYWFTMNIIGLFLQTQIPRVGVGLKVRLITISPSKGTPVHWMIVVMLSKTLFFNVALEGPTQK
jgi:hypothetical protein